MSPIKFHVSLRLNYTFYFFLHQISDAWTMIKLRYSTKRLLDKFIIFKYKKLFEKKIKLN